MSANSRYKSIFQSFQLKHLTLKNRILSTSHAPSYAEDGKPQLRYQLYHEEKAKGGLAMTMFGGASAIAPDSPPAFGQLYVGDDSIIPHFRAFAERIHRHDVALMCQLSHAGRRTVANHGGWLPALSTTAVKEPAHGSFPKVIEDGDIGRIIKAYGAAARRCKEGGLDGCELLVSGHLIGQFWSPLVNQRDDDYGGSLENRLRFGLQVLEEIRNQVGDEFIVGLRFTADEFIEGGLNVEESIEIARLHQRGGLLDFFNVNGGCNWTHAGVAETVPGMAYPGSTYLHIAGRIRAEVDLPVFHAARIGDLDSAEYALKEGLVDMVGMTRAHIADPYLITKHLAGRDKEIRPCVGAGFCIDRIYTGADALCLHNPASGREARIPQTIEPAPKKQKVVIVGAGPGGLEAARAAAERGHDVVLFEALNEVGGQVLMAASAGWRRELIGIVRWLQSRVEALDVDIRYNTLAEAADVLAENPDTVIVATGGFPNTEIAPGAELAISSWDVLTRQVDVADNVLVYDDNGGHQAASLAEVVAEKAGQIELVTPERQVGRDIGATNIAIHLRNLYKQGVRLTPDERLQSIEQVDEKIKVTLCNEYSGETSERIVDQVVIECGVLPATDVYFELLETSRNHGEVDLDAFAECRLEPIERNPSGSFLLYRIGDAVTSRNIHAAMYDAIRISSQL
ncbi:MAG: FAD-dependent oxidoreductase [Woeseiaceae bacterium]|nr:FAD-dependent oxidoreductase [Woeseiaceae bacterium]